jgi:hypothetical protein
MQCSVQQLGDNSNLLLLPSPPPTGGAVLVDNRASFQAKADRFMREIQLARVKMDLKVGLNSELSAPAAWLQGHFFQGCCTWLHQVLTARTPKCPVT